MKSVINLVKHYPINEYVHLEAGLKEHSLKVRPNPVQKVKADFEAGSFRINVLV